MNTACLAQPMACVWGGTIFFLRPMADGGGVLGKPVWQQIIVFLTDIIQSLVVQKLYTSSTDQKFMYTYKYKSSFNVYVFISIYL